MTDRMIVVEHDRQVVVPVNGLDAVYGVLIQPVAVLRDPDPHYWFPADIEGVLWGGDLLTRAQCAFDLLPGELRQARCLIQGLDKAGTLRLWFWSVQALNCAETAYALRRVPHDTTLHAPGRLITGGTEIIKRRGSACVPLAIAGPSLPAVRRRA